MKKNLTFQENVNKADYLLEALDIQTLEVSHVNEEKSSSLIEELEEVEQKLLIEKRQIINTLVKWQSTFDNVANKKNRLLKHIKRENSSKQNNRKKAKRQNNKNEQSHKLFSIVTYGPSLDGLVFTVIAENDALAQDLVRQWLDSNKRKKHKIDKVMALISQDVRGIINVGAKLVCA